MLLISLVFYAWGAPGFVFVLTGSIVVNFLLVKKMETVTTAVLKKGLLAVSIAINVGLLLYFKYFNFFIENISNVLGAFGAEELSWHKVILPIGISFFTFQSLTYTIDVYTGAHRSLKRLTDYALYIMLFPQMIAGPIVRFHTIADQLIERSVTHSAFKNGLHRFIIGLAKKVLIANTLGEYASDALVANGVIPGTTEAWIGILAYTFQIYFDFSGYSDMAIGLGRIMGFRFPENFNNPYTSLSITEFWRKWHITLGVWMRDYLYIPLGGNKSTVKGRVYFNLLFVFLVSGLWHGASWNFVIWGAFHGLFLMLERLFLLKQLKKLPKAVPLFYCFLTVLVGWVFFSIESFDVAVAYLQSMFSFNFEESPVLYERKLMFALILASFFSFFLLFPFGKRIQEWFFNEKEQVSARVLMNSIMLLLLGYSFMHLIASGFNPFIYFRF